MWVIFGNRTKAQPVPGGRSHEQACPGCKAMRRFVECDVADQVSLFFIPVLSGSTRRMVCTTCGEDTEILSVETMQPPAQDETRSVRTTAPQPVSDRDLEKQLAALKKKMKK